MSTIEIRQTVVEDFEIRASGDGDGMTFSGYAAVFNKPSVGLPWIETIKPGAFRDSLKSRATIKMFLNHDSTKVLGSTRSKTLRLSEDTHGLRVEADLPATTDGTNLAVLMRRGDVNEMSFGFSTMPKGDVWADDGSTRDLLKVKLYEVSAVTGFPAYPSTEATIRSIDILADRTGLDVDKLAAAVTLLESGEKLDDATADLLAETVSKLRGTPIPDPVVAPILLDLQRKQLDLLFHKI